MPEAYSETAYGLRFEIQLAICMNLSLTMESCSAAGAKEVSIAHTTFLKCFTKVTPVSNKGPIPHQDKLSFKPSGNHVYNHVK